MKIFDLGELKKSAKLQQSGRSKSIKSPRKASQPVINQSLHLSRWGVNLENRSSREKNQPWANIGQGIYSVAVGEKHAIILNNKNQCYACGNNLYGQLAIQTVQTSRAQQITCLKDMKVIAVYCGSYHSFVQNNKGQIYAFGLNMKGQLGIGTYDDERKPTLVYTLLPGGNKNPKSVPYIETNEYHKKIRNERNQGLTDITFLQNLIQQIQQKNNDITFHLSVDQTVSHISCGPLHTIVLTNRGRMLSCGYGGNYTLGHGDNLTLNQFKQIKSKLNHKIEKLESGIACFGILANSKLHICGKLGQQIYQTLTLINFGQQIKDFKFCSNSCIFLTKKGEVYQFGSFEKESGEEYFSENPRKIEKISNISNIYAGINSCFAVSDNKTLWGWGDNQSSQITGIKGNDKITTPIQIKIPINLNEQIKLISGTTTTYLLSSKSLDIDYDRYDIVSKNEINISEQSDSFKKSLTKKKSSIKMNQKNLLQEIGGEARTFNKNNEIDFEELIFDKQVSEGGYGIIYRGKWRESTVAIKMFKIQSETAVRDFYSQCAAMQALRHPNIVMYLGACKKLPNLAIVLEYCSRGSLWSILQNLQNQLTWEDRRRFALDTAKGVNYLHSCDPPIIHRDLKSLNLLLDDSNHVKLADFGWTKGLDNYMTGKIGTYQWMAPQVIGSQQYSEKADVFSFGIILWQIASRQPPYLNLTGLQVSMQVLNNDLRPTIPKKTPEAYARLMKRCWDREPSRRPSFKQIIKQLEIIKL